MHGTTDLNIKEDLWVHLWRGDRESTGLGEVTSKRTHRLAGETNCKERAQTKFPSVNGPMEIRLSEVRIEFSGTISVFVEMID